MQLKYFYPIKLEHCFEIQAQLLMIVHHRNEVSLVGYCDEGEKKALIYEFMANGNLHQHLSGIYHLPFVSKGSSSYETVSYLCGLIKLKT